MVLIFRPPLSGCLLELQSNFISIVTYIHLLRSSKGSEIEGTDDEHWGKIQSDKYIF